MNESGLAPVLRKLVYQQDEKSMIWSKYSELALLQLPKEQHDHKEEEIM